uniref:Uncharacterized protein n=1 Tax=Tanacetum cinerariifolium TaxID=118510 RepID=A0A699KVX3_TANCI|nr:hypothetical protein [Tanacetum cinerariifolium]
MSPIKPKKPSRRASKAKKNDTKEPPKDWTTAEEIALCQAWCDVSENSEKENSMKAKGFGKRLLSTLTRKLVQQEDTTRSLANEKIRFALKMRKDEGATRVLYTVEESGVGYPGGEASRSCRVEKRETCNTASNV